MDSASVLTFFAGKQKNNQRLSIFLSLFFIVSVVTFNAIYLGFQIKQCNSEVNRVPGYVEGSTCYCKNNLANNGLWMSIIADSKLYKQFNSVPVMLPSAQTVQSLPFQTDTNQTMTLIVKSLSGFYNYYLPIIFSNRLNNVTFDIFTFEDYLHIAPEPLASTGLLNAECGIGYNATYKVFYNDTSICRDIVMTNRKSFVSSITFSYDNELLRTLCDLDYCERFFCSSSSLIALILFCISISGVIYTAFSIFYHFGVHIMERNARKKQLQNNSDATIKHLSYEMSRM